MAEQEYVMCADGKKRKAKTIVCKQCGKTHLKRITSRAKYEFCSLKCSGAAKVAEGRVYLTCSWCDKQFSRRKGHTNNSKSGLFFCCRECKDSAQKLGGIEEIQPDHYGTAKEKYRHLFTSEELYCRRCGYKEFECSVHIHHIDENREHNDKSNLIPLCGNCHWALHHNGWTLEQLGDVATGE